MPPTRADIRRDEYRRFEYCTFASTSRDTGITVILAGQNHDGTFLYHPMLLIDTVRVSILECC